MSNKKLTDARRAASVTMQMASMPIPAPEGWACDADGIKAACPGTCLCLRLM